MSSLITRIASRLGFVPQAEAARQVSTAAQRVAHSAAMQQRSLLAALTTHDVASWTPDGQHINALTESGLATVRARSRDAAVNNGWGRRFVGMVLRNVLGPQGMVYQSRVRASAGDLRKSLNDSLEAGHKAWGAQGVCDVTGRYTRADVDRLALRHMVVDGEAFIRFHQGRGPHGLQLQLLTADCVPIGARADLGGGIKVRQGIETNAEGKVLAYHMRGPDTAADVAAGFGSVRGLVRVPAEEVLHLFVPEFADQLRGIPWLAAGLKPMFQAADFATSGLNKARESAKRGGWLKSTADAAAGGPAPKLEHMTDGEDASGQAYQSLHDGTWEKLPYGLEAVAFDSNYPNIEYGQFIKDCVRNIASALEVSYITLGNDLESVNYSSGQLGLEDERTFWLTLQNWWRDHCSAPVLARWMPMGLLAAPELSGLSYTRLPQYLAGASWQGHRWKPLDALKHVEAQRSRIEARLSSPQREMTANGDDPDEILAEIREWATKTADLPAVPAAAGNQPAAPADPAAREALRLRLIANRHDE